MWVLPTDLAEDAAPRDVVGQAGKWLHHADVGHPLLDHVDHLAHEVPALSGLVAQLDDLLRLLDDSRDVGGHLETLGGAQGGVHRLLVLLEHGQEPLFEEALPLLGAKRLPVVVATGEGVVHEPHEPGQNGLAPLGLDDLDDVIVGIGMELHEDLTQHPHSRFAWLVTQRQGLEGVDDAAHQCGVAGTSSPGGGGAAVLEVLPTDRLPPLHELVG